MCDICLQSECPSGCPNAPDPKPGFRCQICDEGIYPGDEYAEIDDGRFCKDCIENMTPREILNLCGHHTWLAADAS